MAYKIESSEQEKFNHFKALKTLPELLMNFEESGWFTKGSLTSIMFSSGYTQIKNTDMNLVKIFDSNIINNTESDVEGYALKNGIKKTGNCYLENFADEKRDDLKCNTDDLDSIFSKNPTYIVGGVKNDGTTDFSPSEAAFFRYNSKLSGIKDVYRNLVRKSNNFGEMPRIYMVTTESQPRRAIQEIIKHVASTNGNYLKCQDDEIQEKYYIALEPLRTKFASSKFLDEAADQVQKMLLNYQKDTKIHSLKTYDAKVYAKSAYYDKLQSIMNNLYTGLRNLGTVFSDYPELMLVLDNYEFGTSNEQIGWSWNGYFAYDSTISYNGVTGHISELISSDISYQSQYRERVIQALKTLFNSILDLKKWIEIEFTTGIGYTLQGSTPIIFNDFEEDGYKDKDIFYLSTRHCFLDYTAPNGTYFNGTACERSYIITAKEIEAKGMDDFILVGFRFYFAIDFKRDRNSKNNENAPAFIDFLEQKLSTLSANQRQLSEIALMFRNKSDKKLYRYMINLLGYETVINNSYKNEAAKRNIEKYQAIYFVPFITNNHKTVNNTIKKLLYEGWYGSIDGNTYTPYTKMSKKKGEAVFGKTYVQFGSFEGDKYGINNISTTMPAKNLKALEDTTGMATDDYGEPLFKFTSSDTWLNKQPEKNKIKTQGSGERYPEITARQLKDVVIGCFTNKKPNFTAKPSITGWAFSANKNAFKVNLRTKPLYTYNAVIKDELGNVGKFYGIDFADVFTKGNFTMNRFESEHGMDGKIVYTKDSTPKAYIEMEKIISAGDQIFKANFEGTCDYYYNNSGEITKICEQEVKYIASGHPGKPTNYYYATDSMIERVKGNEIYVSNDGKEKEYEKGKSSKCFLYLDTKENPPSIKIGYGFSYAYINKLKGTETYKQFNNFVEDHSDVFNKGYLKFDANGAGQIRLLKTSSQTYMDSFKENIKNPVISNYCVSKDYSISQADASKALQKILTSYIESTIQDLKLLYKVLYGKECQSDAEFINSIFKNLNQSAFDILVDCKYDGETGYENFIVPLSEAIKKEVKNGSSLTDDERIQILNRLMPLQAKKASQAKVSNNRVKQFGELNENSQSVFFLVNNDTHYDEKKDDLSKKAENKKLNIELECITNVDGYVESIFGEAFNLFIGKSNDNS